MTPDLLVAAILVLSVGALVLFAEWARENLES